MPVLQISPNLSIENPEAKLLRYLGHEWEPYDGIPIPHDGVISLFDILLSNMMNVRLDTANKISTVWAGKAEAERALGTISPDASLLHDAVDWEALTDLFNQFCAIKWVGPTVATKILHKKRPAFIPIIDSVMSTKFFLVEQPNIPPNRAPIGERLVANMRYFRERLIGCQSEIERLCDLARQTGYPVTPVRALEILIWIKLEPNRYSDNTDS